MVLFRICKPEEEGLFKRIKTEDQRVGSAKLYEMPKNENFRKGNVKNA